MRFPWVVVERGDMLPCLDWSPSFQRRMGPMRVIEVLEVGQFLFQSRTDQNSMRSKHSRRSAPINRSTNGWDSGTYGTLLTSITQPFTLCLRACIEARGNLCHGWRFNASTGAVSAVRTMDCQNQESAHSCSCVETEPWIGSHDCALGSRRSCLPQSSLKRSTRLYCPRVLGQWFDGIRFYAGASSPTRSRRTWAGLR